MGEVRLEEGDVCPAKIQQGLAKYDLVANHCECFANRAMYGQSTQTQEINTANGALFFARLSCFLRSSRQVRRRKLFR